MQINRLTPSVETLLEDGHLAEAASATTASGKEDVGRRLRLDEDGTAHRDATAQLPCNVSEEPVFADAEARMRVKSLDQELGVPQRYGTVRERRGAQHTRKLSLQPADLVLEILCLLAERAFRGVWPDRLDRVSNALYLAFHTIAYYRKVGR